MVFVHKIMLILVVVFLFFLTMAVERFDAADPCTTTLTMANWKTRLGAQIQRANDCEENLLNSQLSCAGAMENLKKRYTGQLGQLQAQIQGLDTAYKKQVSILDGKYAKFINSMNETVQSQQQGTDTINAAAASTATLT